MCGRFTLIVDPVSLQEDLDLQEAPADLHLSGNIAPTMPVAVVKDAENRKVEMFRWGLIPSWAKDPAIGSRLINARAETLHEKPAFRSPFARQRCLILADGFYEWKKQPGGRPQPFHFKLETEKPFAFAGLWDIWQTPDGQKLPTCTIITCAANECVAPYHDRMPVIFDAGSMWGWLDYRQRIPELQSLLRPYPADQMIVQPASTAINRPPVVG